MKDAHDRIIGNGDRVNGTLRRLALTAQNKPRDAFNRWRNFVNLSKNKDILSALNARKLQESLYKIPQRTLRDAYQRIIGDGNKVQGAIRRILLAANRRPHDAFAKWRNYINDIKNKTLLDAIKARGLREALSKIPQRRLKDAYDRVVGGGDKVAGAMRRFVLSANRIPRDALYRWQRYVDACKNGDLLNAVKARRLREALHNIPFRTLNDAFKAVTANNRDKVALALKEVISNIIKRKANAWSKWKKYVSDINRGLILNQEHASRLRILLEGIPRRTVKSAFERVIGSGDRMTGIIRRLAIEIQRKPRDAFAKWRKYLDDIKSRKMLD